MTMVGAEVAGCGGQADSGSSGSAAAAAARSLEEDTGWLAGGVVGHL
jgi:hypothetical protein